MVMLGSVTGELEGTKDLNTILTEIICKLPEEQLIEYINDVQLPIKLQKAFEDKTPEATRLFREGLIKNCIENRDNYISA